MNTQERIFQKLSRLGERLDEATVKKIAAGMIDYLEQHDLTYGEAYQILNLTEDLLRAKQEFLRL